MRALCGAIITAGALVGLGLTAIGIGTRYENARALSGKTPERERRCTPRSWRSA